MKSEDEEGVLCQSVVTYVHFAIFSTVLLSSRADVGLWTLRFECRANLWSAQLAGGGPLADADSKFAGNGAGAAHVGDQ